MPSFLNKIIGSSFQLTSGATNAYVLTSDASGNGTWQAPVTSAGDKGGVKYTFSTTTTNADPGSGTFRYNNSTIASVTAIYLDNVDATATTMTGWYDTWDDGTATVKGQLVITGNDGTTVNVWNVTAITANTGYYTITVTYVAGVRPANGSVQLFQYSPSYSPALPSGTISQYGGSTAPTGYLLCDGSVVSRTTYATLFGIIGSTYGSGDGSTTFDLPDLRGRMPMGAGTGTGLNASGTGAPSGTAQTARTRGQWGGEETHLLTTSEMPSHTHTATVGTDTPDHSHGITVDAGTFNTQVVGLASAVGANYGAWSDSGGTTAGRGSHAHSASAGGATARHSHTVTNASTGGGGRSAVIPPFVVLNYIIKT